jgi:sRNA-binding protein
MLARTPSTFRLIGAGVTSVGALAAIFGAGGSDAQTLAANDVHEQRLQAMAVCDSIRDEVERLGCRGQKSYDFDIARAETARKQAAAARKEAAEHRAAREAAEKRILEHQKAIAEHQKASAKSDAAIAAHRTEAQCLNTLSSALIGKRITPADIDRAEKTPTATTNMCEVVRRLQPRLGELTKQ